MSERSASISRKTTETEITVTLSLRAGDVAVSTGVPFFDHMLDQVARHGYLTLEVAAKGDLEIDAHHTVEDVGIAFGEALSEALGDKAGIRRYGHAVTPMEEALAEVALDLSGRALLVFDAPLEADSVGQFETGLVEEFFQAFARAAGATLHVTLRAGKNPHHCIEAIFKAFARALGDAVSTDPRAGDRIPSTKGLL